MLLGKNPHTTWYVCLADFKDPPTLLEYKIFSFLNVSQENQGISLHCLCSLDGSVCVSEEHAVVLPQSHVRFHLAN